MKNRSYAMLLFKLLEVNTSALGRLLQRGFSTFSQNEKLDVIFARFFAVNLYTYLTVLVSQELL